MRASEGGQMVNQMRCGDLYQFAKFETTELNHVFVLIFCGAAEFVQIVGFRVPT